jgi:hypothetical protein
LIHQLAKQELGYRLFVFDDCSTPLRWDGIDHTLVRPSNRLQLSLGQKRQCLLDLIQNEGEPFAWFDDDDWHPKERLATGTAFLVPPSIPIPMPPLPDSVGYHEGIFCDVKTLQTRKLDTHESLTFNGAVFAPHCAKFSFDPVNRGEDTLWLRKVLADATVVSSPIMEHCWMSHEGNVTGKRGSMTFEGRKFARFDSWELEFLRRFQ